MLSQASSAKSVVKSSQLSGKQNRNCIVGTFDASGEVWPYNGMEGWLYCLSGDVGIAALDATWSEKCGSDIDAWLAQHDAHMRTSAERKEIYSHVMGVSLRPGEAAWIPFGCVHTVSALPGKRDSKKVDDGKSKAKKGPKKKADSAAEFSQLMWIPCLSTRHNKEAVHVTASKVLSRLIAAKQYSHERTESDANYKQYLDTMIDQSGKLKKVATNGAEDEKEAGPVGEA